VRALSPAAVTLQLVLLYRDLLAASVKAKAARKGTAAPAATDGTPALEPEAPAADGAASGAGHAAESAPAPQPADGSAGDAPQEAPR
jgi:hypothetical protein